MTPGEREALIGQYLDGARRLREAVDGMKDADLDAAWDGGWSARQVVHHLADAEMIAAARVRRLVAEEDVSFIAYDEALWARTAHYERPIASSLTLVAAVRASTADFLSSLSEEEWRREGGHSDVDGPYTPESWLVYYASHAHDHARQITG